MYVERRGRAMPRKRCRTVECTTYTHVSKEGEKAGVRVSWKKHVGGQAGQQQHGQAQAGSPGKATSPKIQASKKYCHVVLGSGRVGEGDSMLMACLPCQAYI